MGSLLIESFFKFLESEIQPGLMNSDLIKEIQEQNHEF